MPVVHLASSLRCRPVDETLALAEPLMTPLGISRLTDITRMDRLGMPVFASIRPRGRALRVHAGKGLQVPVARAGALMEAIEFAVAEPSRTLWRGQPMAIGRLLAQFEGQLDLVDFAPVLGSAPTLDDVLITVPCEELGRSAPVHLPAELLFMPFEDPGVPALFGWSSNGLASGNSVDEATLHALLEVLERDALSMNRVADHSRWVPHDSLPAPFDCIVEGWRRLGVETAVRWVPNAFGIACFQACLHEPGRASVHLAGGSGAHTDSGIALARAVCEAAQSRLSHVHGGRDDIVRFFDRYEGVDEAGRTAQDRAVLQGLFDRSRPLAFADVAGTAVNDDAELPELLDGLLRTLAGAGFGRVYRHHFEIDLGGLHVVKVVVPRCEDVENNPARMGRRLFAGVTRTALP